MAVALNTLISVWATTFAARSFKGRGGREGGAGKGGSNKASGERELDADAPTRGVVLRQTRSGHAGSHTLARFFLHSVQALGVTTPKPRLRFETSVVAGPAVDVEGASYIWDLDEVEARSTDVSRSRSSSMAASIEISGACSVGMQNLQRSSYTRGGMAG